MNFILTVILIKNKSDFSGVDSISRPRSSSELQVFRCKVTPLVTY